MVTFTFQLLWTPDSRHAHTSLFSGNEKWMCSLVDIFEWENEIFIPAQLFTQTYPLFNSLQASQDPPLLVCAYELENS